MLSTIFPPDKDWLTKQTGWRLGQDAKGILALNDKAQIVGAVVFDRWSYTACWAYVFITDFTVSRRLLRAAAEYVFDTCQRRFVLALVADSQKHVHRFVERGGFRVIGRIPDGYKDGDDYLIYKLVARDCPWYRPAHKEAA